LLLSHGRYLPPETQVVLVSATLPHEVLEMTSKFMTDPVRVLVKRDELTLEVWRLPGATRSLFPHGDCLHCSGSRCWAGTDPRVLVGRVCFVSRERLDSRVPVAWQGVHVGAVHRLQATAHATDENPKP